MFVCPSIRPHGTARFPLDRLSKFHIRGFFEIRRENATVVKKSDTNNGYFT